MKMALKKIICFFIFCFISSVNATQCIGYYTNSQTIGMVSQWGNKGEQFSSLNTKGTISWPKNSAQAMYKSPVGGVDSGTTYSIALPKRVYVAGNIPLDLYVEGKTAFETPLNPNYQAWLVQTTSEGCGSLHGVWEQLNAVTIAAGQFNISLRGKGLPSGSYKVELPYTIAWGTDPKQSAEARVQGIWTEVNPTGKTGTFNIDFTVKNRCNLLDNQDITLNYGDLTPDVIQGNARKVSRELTCASTADVEISLSSRNVNLNNGSEADIKIKDSRGNEINKITVVGNTSEPFYVESTLNVNGHIVEGEFSGYSILTLSYK